MLKDNAAMATVPVKDMEAAKTFYGDTLGLEMQEADEENGVATYSSGGTSIIVYRTEHAGTNRATAVTWGVGEEFDRIVDQLHDAGVPFERYESLGMKLEGDVHVMNGFRAAWFTDPDGNILHLNNM